MSPSIDQSLAPQISVRDLSYIFPNTSSGLSNILLELPPRHAPSSSEPMALAKRLSYVYSLDGLEGVTYLGLEWVLNPIVRTDIGVRELLKSVGGDYYPERKDELVRVLDIDLDWRMHAVSDGERRRVQLAMGLIRPWRILLLDEITVDLDLLSRSNFLAFLKKETETRACTIVYATHILDNLADWPTHLVHMSLGKVKEWGAMKTFDLGKMGGSGNSRLGWCDEWCGDDFFYGFWCGYVGAARCRLQQAWAAQDLTYPERLYNGLDFLSVESAASTSTSMVGA
ncbi:abc transporter domain-containing [Hyphodiscus hymeniophilus]|uniref:Abc transporter domain-containing n=1 Tax=Hyphodiscus hymeniophilus TaxID=353542 RepID=A0A9P7AW42_9HELO|nr:abc transporter domain-containing [Hyphodiscus hymeniophilus]